MHVLHIILPLYIASIENDCDGYRPNLYITAKLELSGSIDTSMQRYFFIAFNALYPNLS